MENLPCSSKKTVLDAAEREKRIMDEKLHASVCQSLASISIAVGVLSRRVQSGKQINTFDFGELKELVNHATDETRSLIRELKPVSTDPTGLFSALDELATDTAKVIPCDFVCEKLIRVPDPQHALTLTRIAQEAVRNILQHAQATQITLTLARSGSRTVLTIHDNGHGFTGVPNSAMGGFYLMRLYAETVGAEFNCVSEPGKGTTITCALPKQT